ncbi:MAG TPA: MFS transporter [Solirubrobacteraceae bacterium]|nr:MFS transporter [Solirubrobacteraceae bacterium]
MDLSPVRESREFRLLAIGGTISSLGTQAALVALPIQIYLLSHSAPLVGLLGLFELGPMIVVSLVGGAIADRRDRRPVLAAAQVGVVIVTGLLFALSYTDHRPPVIAILILGGLLAGCTALDGVARGSIIPGILGPDRLRAGLAFNYGMYQATGIVGPGLGGLLIAALGGGLVGVRWMYLWDAFSCIGMLTAALAIPPQPPHTSEGHPPVRQAIAEGLRFVVANKALAGSFVIDINAMLFGMPRALFVVLSLTVYHAGTGGTGLLYTAIAVGGTLSVLTSGWVQHVNRLGRVTILMVVLWGAAIGGAGLVRSILPAAIFLAVAGWADGLSAVCRSTISQTVTPDRLRGRMSSVFSLVVTSGPRLGDIESGLMAGVAGALNSVLIGGAGCIVGVGLTMLAFPELAAYEADAAMAQMKLEEAELATPGFIT